MIDYHDFTTIDTSRAERRRLGVGDIWINAATCASCGETVRSKNRHDFATCKCGATSVDGGSWYARRALRPGAGFVNEIVTFAEPGAGFVNKIVTFADANEAETGVAA